MDDRTARMSGRARYGRFVHFAGHDGVRAGDFVTTVVTDDAPHHLIADGPLLSHRRTLAGDLGGRRPGVGLGLPRVGPPPAQAPEPAVCGR